MNTWHERLMVLFVAIIVFSLALIGYWYFVDGVYVNKLNDLPLDKVILRHTTKDVYHPGETVYATIDVCVYKSLDPVIEWQLRDNIITFFEPRVQSLMESKCYKNNTLKVEELPKTIAPDIYRFTGQLRFKINPIKTLVYKLETNVFEVK